MFGRVGGSLKDHPRTRPQVAVRAVHKDPPLVGALVSVGESDLHNKVGEGLGLDRGPRVV